MDIDSLSPEQRASAYRKVVDTLWRRGDLSYTYRPVQLKIHDAFAASASRKFFINSSRRIGKSHFLISHAIGLCLSKRNCRVLYLLPFAKDAALLATDFAALILQECPADLKPEYASQDKEFRFRHNGSVIRLKGVNGEHAQYLRGGSADLVIMDEVGLMDDLKHVVSDVVMPLTLTTNGRIILATTPARTPGHESSEILEQLAGDNAVATFTILDADHIPNELKAEYLKEAGETDTDIPRILAGEIQPKTTTARREYFCASVTDEASAVIPEFTEQAQSEIIHAWPRPPYFDAWTTIDPGMRDRTGILYAYWDFERAKLVIEDESLLSGPNTDKIAKTLLSKERELWAPDAPVDQPVPVYMRISDIDLRLIADLWALHKIHVSPARKEDSLGAINLMRNMVLRREIIINPRCVNLIRQMRNAVWNNKASDFAQGGEIDGHYDLVAALKYLCRMVNRTHNPFPGNWGAPGGGAGVPVGTWFSPKRTMHNRKAQLGLMPNTPMGRRLAKARKK